MSNFINTTKVLTALYFLTLLSGCAATEGSRYGQQNANAEYRDVMTRIHRIIPEDKDIRIFARLEMSFTSNTYIEEMSIVDSDTVKVCSGSYTQSYRGNDSWYCQDGLGYVGYRGDSIYTAELSLKRMKNQIRGNMQSRFPNGIWIANKELLKELALATDSYVAQSQQIAAKLTKGTAINFAPIPFENNSDITFQWLIEQVQKNTNQTSIEKNINVFIEKQKVKEAKAELEAEKKRLARVEREKQRKIERERKRKEAERKRQIKQEQDRLNAIELRKKRSQDAREIFKSENIGHLICKAGELEYLAPFRLGLSMSNQLHKFTDDGQIQAHIEGFSPDGSKLKIRIARAAFSYNLRSAPQSTPQMGNLIATPGLVTWVDNIDWFLCQID